jgi:hypothetical protein
MVSAIVAWAYQRHSLSMTVRAMIVTIAQPTVYQTAM